jgi:hypothetical protein
MKPSKGDKRTKDYIYPSISAVKAAVKVKLLLRGVLSRRNQSLQKCHQVITDYFLTTERFFQTKIKDLEQKVASSKDIAEIQNFQE